MFSTTIRIKSEKEFADAVKQVLEPEKDFKTERAKYEVQAKGSEVIIEVSAEDATAFRAVMSSISGMISIVEKIWKEAKK